MSSSSSSSNSNSTSTANNPNISPKPITMEETVKTRMEKHTTLLKLIDTASIEHLRLVLKMVCIRTEVIERVLGVFEGLGYIHENNDKGKEQDHQEGMKICGRCKKEVLVKDVEGERGCRYHSGNRYLDIESEVWEGRWDGGVECGGVDWEDEEVVGEFGEGFRWDCCDEDGRGEGCCFGGHLFN
ncbi:hypothetical protein TWF506_009160 [Arthrobotrys conoides]|uniref:Uncharacterized protein n=1 Tax=Arthrobotrys conoides TaxID=74498 RepID=A0AAN8RR47_9PEZI